MEEERRWRMYWYKHILPFAAMVAAESGNVVVNILFKASTSKDMMSHYVFITYGYAITALVLFPLPFIFYSGRVVSPLKFHIGSRICLIGLTGFLGQICAYKGIEYSSPTLASAVRNISPALIFILAVLFRLEKVALRSIISQAKIMGTIVSVCGALVVALCKGPEVFSSSSVLHQWFLGSSESNWRDGGLLLVVAYLLFSISCILQVRILVIYKQELSIACFYNLFAAVIAVPVSLMAEPNMTSWRLKPTLVIVTVLYSGVFSALSSLVHVWGIRLKGPVYVVIFQPLSIAIAAFMSAIFLGDPLHLGSVIGAVILSMGFYAVIWAKAKEERIDEDSGLGSVGHLPNDMGPVLEEEERTRDTRKSQPWNNAKNEIGIVRGLIEERQSMRHEMNITENIQDDRSNTVKEAQENIKRKSINGHIEEKDVWKLRRCLVGTMAKFEIGLLELGFEDKSEVGLKDKISECDSLEKFSDRRAIGASPEKLKSLCQSVQEGTLN
ncbi:WAT1-related protein At5g40240-like [Hibiscus syriacus]|uniref:WAT1-related protein At5g40240-like n=1 Tax=Hibiscus syriacus TaxID=106335 RepID=UPI001924D801|nr:WAT1-related protein At5g40240-like [Hibiscus syriacus]